MIETKRRKAKDERTKMYVRIDPKIRKQFKAVAHLLGDTLEGRVEKLMRDDIDANRQILTSAAAS